MEPAPGRRAESSSIDTKRTLAKRLAFAVAVLLLIGAVVVVWQQREMVSDACAAVVAASPVVIALLFAAIVANVVLTALMFNVLISRYGRVGIVEMQALIAGATLLNFLPLRPGLLGRVAYHRAANDIPPLDTARTIVQALLLSAALGAYLALVAMISVWLNLPLELGVVLPGPVLLLAAVRAPWRILCIAALLRYLDLIVWAVRYWMVFDLIGAPIDHRTALALACVSVIANLVPFFSNGLGLREWAVGLLGPFLRQYPVQLGLTAELVNRAAEILVILILGLAGLAWLAHTSRLKARASMSQAG